MAITFIPDPPKARGQIDFVPEDGVGQNLTSTESFGTGAARAVNKVLDYPLAGTVTAPQTAFQGAVGELGRQFTPGNIGTIGLATKLLSAPTLNPVVRAIISTLFAKQGFGAVQDVMQRNPPVVNPNIGNPSALSAGYYGTPIGLPGGEGAISALQGQPVAEGETDPRFFSQKQAPTTPSQEGADFTRLVLGILGMAGGAKGAEVPSGPRPTGALPTEGRPGMVAGQDFPHAGQPIPPRFVVSPSGTTVDARVPSYGEPTGLPEATAVPPVIGEQRVPFNRDLLKMQGFGFPELKVPDVAQAPKPGEGGQISFQAEALGVPSARQSAVEGAGGGAEQPPDLIASVSSVVNNPDRFALQQMYDKLIGVKQGTEQQPGMGMTSQTTDVARLIEARLKELRSSKPNPELQALRNTIAGVKAKPPIEGYIRPEVKTDEPPGTTKGELYSGIGPDALTFDEWKERVFALARDENRPEDSKKAIVALVDKYPDYSKIMRQGDTGLPTVGPGTGLNSGIKPEDLRPAVKYLGRLLVGQRGDTHADVIERAGGDPNTIPHHDTRRGFVDVNRPEDFLDRQSAQQRSGLSGTAEAGGLDSQDLPDASKHRLLRMMEEHDTGELHSGLSPKAVKDLLNKADPEVKKKLEQIFTTYKGDKEFTRAVDLAQKQGTKDITKGESEELFKIDREKRIDASRVAAMLKPGRQEAIAKEQYDYNQDYYNRGLYSGLPSITHAKEATRRVLNTVFGAKVNRSLSEGVEAIQNKHLGYSAPRHVAANEPVANRMIEYAAADVTSEVLGLTPAYKESRLKDWIDSGIKAGIYERIKPGGTPTIQPSELIPEFHNLYVRKDLAPEVKQVAKRRGEEEQGAINYVLDALTELQVVGPTDLTFHMGNMFASIAKSPGKVSNYYADLLLRTPGVKQADAAARIGWNFYKVIQNSPEVKAELGRISALGSLRGKEKPNLLGKLSGGYLDSGKLINLVDKAGRLARDKMFDNLVEQKLVNDTPLNRREFINKMGQYNSKLMSMRQEWMRNHFSQFVVAGRTFNRNAMQSLLSTPEFRAANPEAYAKIWASNLIALTATWTVFPIVINALWTGKPFGRKGTPIGEIDTGHNDENGRLITIDPAKSDLSRRGSRISGMEAVESGIRRGEKPEVIGAKAIRDIYLGQVHPWTGPGVRVGLELYKDYKSSATPGEAVVDAAKAINPTLTAFFSKDESGKKGGVKGVLKQLGGAVGITTALPTHAEALENISGKDMETMSLRERVVAEKEHKVERKLGTGDRAKNIARAVEFDIRRGEDVVKELTKADQQWLQSRNIPTPGYDNVLRYQGTRVPLSLKEQARLAELIKDEYGRAIGRMRGHYDNLNERAQATYLSEQFSTARAVAHTKLMKEIETKTGPEAKRKQLGTRSINFTPE